ncbi:MAG: hypothetical protein ACR2NZ_00495 [Rubripirellula sp.]
MAKKKTASVNKSQTIRDYSKSNPDQKPKQIAEALAKKGIKVSPQFVSTILSTSKKKTTTRKAGRPKGSKSRATSKTVTRRGRPAKKQATSTEVSLESLLKVKEVVSEMGGVENVRTALKALEALLD